MRLRPALLLAAPAGVLAGHAIGYAAAPGPAGAAALHHGYLALVLAVAVPLAVLAVAWAATAGSGRARGARPGAIRPIAAGPLLVSQWVLFTGQEATEHAFAGHGPAAVLQSRALWCGLAAQVVTALAVVVLLRVSATAGARLITLSARCRPISLTRLPWRPAEPPALRSLSSMAAGSARGPPAVRFA